MSIKDALKEVKSTEALSIIGVLDSIMVDDRKGSEDRTGMHASGIIASEQEFCIRQQVLSFVFKGSEAFIPISLRRIFKAGTSIHQKWQEMFRNAGIAEAIEQRGHSKLMSLLFTPDAIVRIGKRRYVVEIKSVNTYQFQRMSSHPSGEKQLQLYMYQTAIPHGFVLCEDKNTQDIKVFPYKFEPEKARPFIERMFEVKRKLKLYIAIGKLPQRKCKSRNDRLAKRCAYADACFGEKKEPLDAEEYKKLRRKWMEQREK